MSKSNASNTIETLFLQKRNFPYDDNEPEAKKPKVIYKRCADCTSKRQENQI